MSDVPDSIENQPTLPHYPELHEMQDYFDIRTKTDPQKTSGIAVSNDAWGNKVYASLNKTEDTMAGEQPATLIASSEGRRVLLCNSGLLRKIQTGDIPLEGIKFQSNIYPIELDTPEGKRKFVLKYADYKNMEKYKTHVSGIEAMRIMQMASKEQPLPGVSYAVPLLATHDFTIAPLLYEGLALDEMIGYLDEESNEYRRERIETAWNRSPEAVKTLRLLKEENKTPIGRNFLSAIWDETNWASQKARKWIEKTVEKTPEFQAFKLHNDFGAHQYVIDMSNLMDLYEKYKSQPEEWRVDDGFGEELMKILGVVEMIHAFEPNMTSVTPLWERS